MDQTTELQDFFIETLQNKEQADNLLYRFIDYFGGQNIYIPKKLANIVRARAIKTAFHNNKSVKDICRSFKVSQQHVYDIINGKVKLELEPAANQKNLF